MPTRDFEPALVEIGKRSSDLSKSPTVSPAKVSLHRIEKSTTMEIGARKTKTGPSPTHANEGIAEDTQTGGDKGAHSCERSPLQTSSNGLYRIIRDFTHMGRRHNKGSCWAFKSEQSVNMFMPSGHEKPIEESVEYEEEGELICTMEGDA